MFPCKFCKIFNNTIGTKHLRPTPLTQIFRPTPFFDPHESFMDPRHLRNHALKLPTPPTLFSRLKKACISFCLVTFIFVFRNDYEIFVFGNDYEICDDAVFLSFILKNLILFIKEKWGVNFYLFISIIYIPFI